MPKVKMPKKTKAKSSSRKKSKGRKGKKPKPEKAGPPPPQPPPPRPPTQGEFVCVHVGRAGVRVGSACWELFCLEHGINPDGTVHRLATSSTAVFSVSPAADTYAPRALFVDTEPSAIDAIRNGNHGKLFPDRSMICGKENAAGNYAAGFYGVGKRLSLSVMEQLARLTEDCDHLQGFAVFRSLGGGTGSGTGSRIVEAIRNTYPSKTIIDFNVYSSEPAPIIVEPYNVALATRQVLDAVNYSLIFDNRSLYGICSSKLDLFNPTYENLNSLIALVTSGVTSSLRFEGSMTGDISGLLSNLVAPRPRLHFPLITHAPVAGGTGCAAPAGTQLASMCFDRGYQTTGVDPGLGRCLSVAMMFRGDLKPAEVNTTVAFVQREQTIPVTQDMSSPLFKFGLCCRPPVTVPRSGIAAATRTATTLCNNTAIKHCWIDVMEKFNRLLTKRAFLHHYTAEGMEEGAFDATNQNIAKLIAEYEEIENPQNN